MAEDYFIGVHAREIERLREQHAAWLPETQALWHQAQFGEGQHIVDLGSGPGFTALDLARRVGPSGRVAALDKASAFLSFVVEESRKARLENVYPIAADIVAARPIPGDFDGAFCRFFLAFLIADLDRVLQRIHRSLKPGGTFAVLEYLTLESATCAPPIRGFHSHTQAWIDYYLDHGGDTAVGTYLPARLTAAGFHVTYTNCVGGMARPSDRWWRWWGRLMHDFGDKLVAEGLMEEDDFQNLQHDWALVSRLPDAFIYTPVLIQIVARKAL